VLLPPRLHQVLDAMVKDDPHPSLALDSVPDAIHRRCPSLEPLEAAEVLHMLNALGLTRVPFVTSIVSPTMTSSLRQWITPEGWKALGTETPSLDQRPS